MSTELRQSLAEVADESGFSGVAQVLRGEKVLYERASGLADRETVMLEGMDAGVSFRSAYDPPSEVLYTVISNTPSGAWPLTKELDRWVPDLVQEGG